MDSKKSERWIEKQLSHPGISDDELALRKAYWMASLVCAIVIIILTVTFKLINPELKILFAYGAIMGFLFLEWVIELLIFHYNIERRMFINQVIMSLLTFGAILLLGGIPSSGGLVFVGFFVVLFSLDFKKRVYSTWLFIIYLLTLVFAGILQPFLTVPPEMTRAVNVSLYVINLMWISSLSFLFVLNFVRERVKIEQREADRLKELDQMKTRLYSNITHEFRTPLTIILGMAGLIRDKPGEWVEEGTRKIENHGHILLHQVNQMLDLSKLESSSMPLHMTQGDIIPLIGHVVELFRSSAVAKSISLSYSPSLAHFFMDYDAEKIAQVLSNLLSNALKYTGEGACVELQVFPSRDGESLEIRVRDNGPGIPKEAIPHLFERFFMVDQGNEQAIEGSGLGLALCRELMKLLGGRIYVESILGEGALFYLSLPVSNLAPFREGNGKASLEEGISTLLAHHNVSVQQDDQKPEGSSEGGNSERPCLLIVEDQKDVVDYLKTLVDPYYYVLTANNGKAGYEAALAHVPDIILTDVMMPKMDGIQMLGILKSDIRTSHIPVIVLSARVDLESRLAGLERGAEAYMAKPFNRDELLIRLRTLVDLRRKLHARYSGSEWIGNRDDKEFQLEDKFIGKVQDMMTQNLGNENFDIPGFSEALSMSRSQLYRKFKTLTNMTIGEYLRTFRLNKAREMLEGGRANVSEAAYRTGFRNLSHFSRTFSNEFGYKPSDILSAAKLLM
ncbi:MAG: ATP-binding protein [Bacteroides sp.]|nr:ATP-binding protein [Bacteroides sp.]